MIFDNAVEKVNSLKWQYIIYPFFKSNIHNAVGSGFVRIISNTDSYFKDPNLTGILLQGFLRTVIYIVI